MLVKSKNNRRNDPCSPAANGTMPENAWGWLPKCLAFASGDTEKVTKRNETGEVGCSTCKRMGNIFNTLHLPKEHVISIDNQTTMTMYICIYTYVHISLYIYIYTLHTNRLMENQAFIFQGRPYLSLLFYQMYIHKNNGPKYHVKSVTYQLLSHDNHHASWSVYPD